MSLLRMGSPEDARILDDVDLTLTLDSRTMSSHQMTLIRVLSQPNPLKQFRQQLRVEFLGDPSKVQDHI